MVIKVEPLGVAYTAVPKAGSSSVKAMLAQVDPGVSLPAPEDITNRTYHSLYRTRRYDDSRFATVGDKFLFTVVRDPIRRLMSVYTNRILGTRDMQRSRGIEKRRDLPVEPDPDFFFAKLRKYARRSKLIAHHLLPTEAFTGPDIKRFDAVYRTDQMTDVANLLSARAGTTVSLERANKSEAKLEFDDLKPQTRDRIRPYLAAEYRYLSGVLDNPFA